MEEFDRNLSEQDGKEIFAAIFALFVFTAVAFQYQNLNLLPQTQVAAAYSAGQVQTLPNASANVTVESLQLQIQQLLAEITKLKAELAKLGGQSSKSTLCYSFERNLRIGDKGSDISALQKVLRAEGFGINDADSVFDESTASAVVGLQEKYRNDVLAPNNLSRGTGFVGMSTRSKLNALYRCLGQNTNSSSTSRVTTPSGTVPAVPATPAVPGTGTTPTVPAIPATPAIPTTQSNSSDATVQASLVGTNEDKAGTNHVFGPGGGSIFAFPYGNDFHWKATLNLSSEKTISSILVSHNRPGEYWSTSANILYPLVVVKDGVQINTVYSENLMTLPAGSTVLELYGQIENNPWNGGKISVNFSDGTTASATIESSAMPIVKLLGLNFWLYKRNDDRAGTQGVFAPGAGLDGSVNSDWVWKVTISVPSTKTIKSAVMIHNATGEAWSTSADTSLLGKLLYPLVMVYKGPGGQYSQDEYSTGTQVNNAYDQTLGEYTIGVHLFWFHGQRETIPFAGSKLIVTFTDGTSVTTTMPNLPWPTSTTSSSSVL